METENNEGTPTNEPDTDVYSSNSARNITNETARPDSSEHLFTRRQNASRTLHNSYQHIRNNDAIPRRNQTSPSDQMIGNGVTGRSRVRIDTCNTQNRVGSGTSRRSLAETDLSDNNDDNDDDRDDDRFLIPVLPLEISVVCCVLNFIIPGLGTVIAGFSVLCCGKPSDITKRQSCGSCLATIGIGILQLLMVSCFLIGWVWSGIWGVSLVSMSMDYYKEDPGSHWRRPRRPRSTLIYPLRARSNTRYHSPPPPYQMYSSPPPGYYAPDEDLEEAARIAGTELPTDNQEPSQRVVQTSGRDTRTYWQCNVCRKQNESGDQKNKCRRCFETVCNDCHNKHVTAPSGQKILVCDLCYGEVGLLLSTPGYPDLGLPVAPTDEDMGLNTAPTDSHHSVHDTL
ncbi:hypothetical protein FSP39_013859 [Pinctada imbricata]|uniref:FYVE-type domain-containing protein n=1 Tax=Pinctada imbricata TaxID=66713 RepID=A0AA88YDK9_PINIB|nr:hypothetical protein FSP39_013859 [Pinctada imbricata]